MQIKLQRAAKYEQYIYFRSRDDSSVKDYWIEARWLVQSKLQENLLVERPHVNSWQPRLLVRVPQPLVESRNPIVTGQELLPFVKSEDTRNPPSFSFASCHSSVLFEKSPRTSRLISDSRALPSWLFKRLLRLTWLDFSKTPTCAPSTPNVSPSCQKISNWQGGSVENVHKS